MAKMYNFDFKWNNSRVKIIENKGFGKSLNKELANILLAHSDKYTPFSLKDYSGRFHMAQMAYTTATKDSGSIVYSKKYAKYQYTKPMQHTLDIHPLATDHWVEVAYTMERTQILQELNRARKRLAK